MAAATGCGLRAGNAPLPFARCDGSACAGGGKKGGGDGDGDDSGGRYYCPDCLNDARAHPCRRGDGARVPVCELCGEPITEATVRARGDWAAVVGAGNGVENHRRRHDRLAESLRRAKEERTRAVDRVRGGAAEKRTALGAEWSGWTREDDDDLAIARRADPRLCAAIDALEAERLREAHTLACVLRLSAAASRSVSDPVNHPSSRPRR